MDVTDHTRIEEALRESEQTIRSFVETSRDWIWAIDVQGVHTYSNPAVEEILGYPPGDLVGKSNLDLMHADDRYVVEAGMPQWIHQRRGWQNLVFRWRHKDGMWRWLESNAVPILDADGELTGFRGVDRDITDRKQAEERSRLLSLITEQVSDAVITTNLDYEITYTNRSFQRLYGYSPEEARGASPDMLNADPDSENIQQEIYRTVASGRVWRGEHVNRRKDGSTFLCEMAIFPLVDDQGKVFAYASMQRDVTERERAEEQRRHLEAQVQHAQKLESLGLLAGGIAHDFNNLLTVILGNAELALRDLSDVSPARPSVKEIKKAGLRAAQLTNQMLAYSGKGLFVVTLLDLNQLVQEMGHLLEVGISKKTSLHYDLAPDLPAIEADVAQIQQVMMNLVINAAEAIGDDTGAITVRTGVTEADRAYLSATYLTEDLREGSYVYLQVSDTGQGMDEETQSRLFEPFFTTKFAGRGLGMAAVLGIVRGHKGTIKVDSRVGKGTTFRLLFPCGAGSDRPVVGPEETGAMTDWHCNGTVLVVDDEEGVRDLVKRMLESAGFTVRTATDGRDAVEVFRKHADQITAVLLDMTMPQMNGEEAFRELRRLRHDVPVLLCSGHAEEDATRLFAGKGLAGFIHKPFDSDDVIARVREALQD